MNILLATSIAKKYEALAAETKISFLEKINDAFTNPSSLNVDTIPNLFSTLSNRIAEPLSALAAHDINPGDGASAYTPDEIEVFRFVTKIQVFNHLLKSWKNAAGNESNILMEMHHTLFQEQERIKNKMERLTECRIFLHGSKLWATVALFGLIYSLLKLFYLLNQPQILVCFNVTKDIPMPEYGRGVVMPSEVMECMPKDNTFFFFEIPTLILLSLIGLYNNWPRETREKPPTLDPLPDAWLKKPLTFPRNSPHLHVE